MENRKYPTQTKTALTGDCHDRTEKLRNEANCVTAKAYAPVMALLPLSRLWAIHSRRTLPRDRLHYGVLEEKKACARTRRHLHHSLYIIDAKQTGKFRASKIFLFARRLSYAGTTSPAHLPLSTRVDAQVPHPVPRLLCTTFRDRVSKYAVRRYGVGKQVVGLNVKKPVGGGPHCRLTFH